MSSIGGLLGMNGGAGGTGFSGPNQANITNPVKAGQTDQAYANVQNAQGQQNNLLAALQAQNGLQNQSNVYGQLQGVVNGTGPNPAQAQLAQATGANTANQAALMASQRGTGANAGLIARQAAMQGGANQQQSAGQAATLQAQQSLNALGQAGQMAGNMAQNQIGQTNANTAAQQAEQGQLLNAQAGVNNAQVGMQSNINNANASMANTTMQGQQGLIGGAMNGVGAALGLANGGAVKMADGGDPSQGPRSQFTQFLNNVNTATTPTDVGSPNVGPNPGAEKMANSMKAKPQAQAPAAIPTTPGPTVAGGATDTTSNMSTQMADPNANMQTFNAARGGLVPAMVSPGEQYLPPRDVAKVAKGASPMAVGEKIGGKPKVGGAKNSYANDTVPKTLEEGGIVIPRSITQGKNPHWEAMKFIKATMAKNGKGLK